jgi:hypothetical protein
MTMRGLLACFARPEWFPGAPRPGFHVGKQIEKASL